MICINHINHRFEESNQLHLRFFQSFMLFLATIFDTYTFTGVQWMLILVAAIITGMSKAGINTISIISISIWASILDSKSSTGMVLPMLILADIMAVWYYKRRAVWSHLIRLMPWVMGGVILATLCGQSIDDQLFKRLMALIILISLIALFWWDRKPQTPIPTHPLFASSMGLATGFTSMIGNLAGGFSNVYFVSMRLTKDHFIGTVAWLFFMLNLFKLPFHIWVWKTVSMQSFLFNLALIPFIAIGFWLGLRLLSRLNEVGFKQMILWLTTISSLLVLLDLR